MPKEMREVMSYDIEGENENAKIHIHIEMVDIAAAGALFMSAAKRTMADLAKKWAETPEGKQAQANDANGTTDGDGDGEEVEIPGVGTVKKGALVRC